MERPTRTGRPRLDSRPLEREPRNEIIAVSTRLFAVQGFAHTTMRQIAAAAGLHQSSVYYYFSSKEAVLEEIASSANRASLHRLTLVNEQGGTPALRLYRLIRFDARLLCDLPYDINEVLRLSAMQDDSPLYWDDRQALNDGVEAIIVDGLADGSFQDTDPRLAALTLLSNDEAAQNWFRQRGERHLAGRPGDAGPYTPTEVGDFLADWALLALLARRRQLPGIRARARAADAVRDEPDLD